MRFKSKLKETFFRKWCKDMSIVFVSVICTFAAYAFGLGVETMPNVDLPGFGLVLAVIVMGAFLMFQIIRKKESD